MVIPYILNQICQLFCNGDFGPNRQINSREYVQLMYTVCTYLKVCALQRATCMHLPTNVQYYNDIRKSFQLAGHTLLGIYVHPTTHAVSMESIPISKKTPHDALQQKEQSVSSSREVSCQARMVMYI